MSDGSTGNPAADRPPPPYMLAALWFGASVSLAEIATGGLLAGGPVRDTVLAILLGHLAGAVLFFGAGWVSWRRNQRAIAVCNDTFGSGGPVLFGILNLIQLVGWTAVMIVVGARSLDRIAAPFFGFKSEQVWRTVLGLLVLLWSGLGPRRIGAANTAAAVALGLLCAALSGRTIVPFLASLSHFSAPASTGASAAGNGFRFGQGFELSILMPLSWLPLVGDYICGARNGRNASLASAGSYTLGSIWMYSIGLGAVTLFGSSDPVALMTKGWGLPVLVVVLLSTVTTAFLDARSAGISLYTAFPKVSERAAILVAASAGLILAWAAPVERYEAFLGLIGSVFAPLYALIFADFFLHQRTRRIPGGKFAAFALWAFGVGLYQYLSPNPGVAGTSLPVMGLVAALYILYALGAKKWTS